MIQQELCPDCGELIPAERIDTDMSICTCGAVVSDSQKKASKSHNKKASYTIIITSLILVSSFIHTSKWGKDSVKVTPLEASRVFGTISPEQALKLGNMSMEKKFFQQAEKMYKIYLGQQPENLEVNKKLGMLLFRQENFEESSKYLEKYTSLEGNEKDVLFAYAQSLTKIDQRDKAAEIYLEMIKNNPEVYQTTVVQSLVDLYVSQGQLKEAKDFISNLIQPGYEVPAHLREQRDQVDKLMKSQAS